MTDDSLFLIDVDKILRTKAPKHYKYIPKFVVSYLKKIVHQDEINVFLNESKDKLGVDFLSPSGTPPLISNILWIVCAS